MPLEAKKERLAELRGSDGYGETSISNLVAGIDARRHIPLDRFIFGLGIRHIGETTSLALARHYETVEAFIAAYQRMADRLRPALAPRALAPGLAAASACPPA